MTIPTAGRARTTLLFAAGILISALAVMRCNSLEETPRFLLLITVDTLRADHLGAYGDTRGLTPNLDRLAEQSVLFRSAYASAPVTFPSVVSILTGHHPETYGVVRNSSRLPKTAWTLAKQLKKEGWKTGAVVSNVILEARSGLSPGFDEYDARFPQNELVRQVRERTATDTTDAALEVLDRLSGQDEGSLFLWVHYQDPHGPYTPPDGLRDNFLEIEREKPGGRKKLSVSHDVRGMGGIPDYQYIEGHHDVAFYRAGYDGEIRYMDEEVGRLLEEWKQRGLDRESIILFTSDHGEGLGEGDYWFAHGEYLSESLLHVPLFIRLASRLPASRSDLTSLVDLFPTLSALLGARTGTGYPGRDLFAPGAEELSSVPYFMTTHWSSTITRYGLASDGFKYVVALQREGPMTKLTELGNDAENVLDEFPDRASSMRAELNRIRKALPQGNIGEVRMLSEQDREELRALGYVGD